MIPSRGDFAILAFVLIGGLKLIEKILIDDLLTTFVTCTSFFLADAQKILFFRICAISCGIPFSRPLRVAPSGISQADPSLP